MRILSFVLIVGAALSASGCLCFENSDQNPYVLGLGRADPSQPAWHRFLFGTRRISSGVGPHSSVLDGSQTSTTD